MDFDDFKFFMVMMSCLVGFLILIMFLSAPMFDVQCDKFNELFQTSYTHSEWWWNSEAIKLKHAASN